MDICHSIQNLVSLTNRSDAYEYVNLDIYIAYLCFLLSLIYSVKNDINGHYHCE